MAALPRHVQLERPDAGIAASPSYRIGSRLARLPRPTTNMDGFRVRHLDACDTLCEVLAEAPNRL